MVMQAAQRGISLSPTAKSDAVTQARAALSAQPPFGQQQAKVPDAPEQASRVSNRAALNASQRLSNPGYYGPNLSDLLNPSGSVYPARFIAVPTSGTGVMPTGGYAALAYALDLPTLDRQYTPNLPDEGDGKRYGRGDPYRDTSGKVFYKTYDVNGVAVGWLTVASRGESRVAHGSAVGGSKSGTPSLTNALAMAGPAVLRAELSSGNPYLIAGAGLGLAGAAVLVWLSQPSDASLDAGAVAATGASIEERDNTPGASARISGPSAPRRNPGYAEGAAPVDTRPLINVPAEPQPPIGGYTPLSQEERDRMSAPVTTPIPDVVANWILVYPAADPAVIADLVMMSTAGGGGQGETKTGSLTGTPASSRPNDNEETERGRRRENDAAILLASNGYNVRQSPGVSPNGREPDYNIDGELFDCYSPGKTNVRNAASFIAGKVIQMRQAENIVVNLADSAITPSELLLQLETYPIEGLKKLIIIDNRGNITPISFPRR